MSRGRCPSPSRRRRSKKRSLQSAEAPRCRRCLTGRVVTDFCRPRRRPLCLPPPLQLLQPLPPPVRRRLCLRFPLLLLVDFLMSVVEPPRRRPFLVRAGRMAGRPHLLQLHPLPPLPPTLELEVRVRLVEAAAAAAATSSTAAAAVVLLLISSQRGAPTRRCSTPAAAAATTSVHC